MKINSIKLNKDPEKIIHNKTLVDFLYDEYKDTPHVIFKAAPNKCAKENMITFDNKEEFLNENDCEYTIVETPGDVFTAIYAIVAILAVAVAVYVYMNLPDVPENQGTGSNNSLSARTNKQRPLGRIEDIAGKVRSYPTLIQEPYIKFNDDQKEVEYSLMCVSKGYGEITKVKDGETPISKIPNAGAMFYEPYNMPSADPASLTVGDSFNEPVKTIIRSNEVSGGIVLDYGESVIVKVLDGNTLFYQATGTDYGTIDIVGGSTTFERLNVDDEISISAICTDDGINFYSIEGSYVIKSKTNTQIVVDSISGGGAVTEDADWANLNPAGTPNAGDAEFAPLDPEVNTVVGPYFLSDENRESFFFNIVARSGLQYNNEDSLTVGFQVEYAQANEDGDIIGPWSTPQVFVITGQTKDRIGKTIEITTPFTGPCLVRMQRLSDELSDAQRQDISLDALYSVSPCNVENFGDVTTVQVRVVANGESTQQKKRKFNCEFERKLYVINANGSFGDFLPTKRFIDYYAYAALEKRIGRRDYAEVNFKELYERYIELVEYFGSSEAGEFSYTFDSDQVSFQETLKIICGACFGRPVRKAGILTVRTEIPQLPTTIFTHRNKIPNSQTITRKLSSANIKDGVELQYVDPKTSETLTINIPDDGTALRPEKVETKGVRNHNQAWWLAWRRYNDILYNKIALQDTLTAEGALLSVGDVVSITNNTKQKSFGGEVIDANGLLLTLSEPVEFTPDEDHYILLRKRNGEINSILCYIGNNDNEVILDEPPEEELYTGYNEQRTIYVFGAENRLSSEEYIITEVDRKDRNSIPITAINYSENYYEKDGSESPNN